MDATIDRNPRDVLTHLSAWVQAAGLVYAVVLGLVLFGGAVVFTIRGAIELLSWIAGLLR